MVTARCWTVSLPWLYASFSFQLSTGDWRNGASNFSSVKEKSDSLVTRSLKVPGKKDLGVLSPTLLVEVLVNGQLLHHLGLLLDRDFVAEQGKANKVRSQVSKVPLEGLPRGLRDL
ncbi:hypothetical protein GWK47_015690 [Chionoecetes opilio]|uniref:Secreted protein n=1 Tax=Chionoecetes opilio TaxID=41210 RepID=A0A8J5CK10_CHIOP|nr:hypothetical protein GWK47_015690 [Chionoecetes opilio]